MDDEQAGSVSQAEGEPRTLNGYQNLQKTAHLIKRSSHIVCPRQNSNIVPSMGIKTFSKNVSYKIKKTLAGLEWCPRQNSNLQPFAPQANALSNCATGTF
jgi:hypothetical protein